MFCLFFIIYCCELIGLTNDCWFLFCRVFNFQLRTLRRFDKIILEIQMFTALTENMRNVFWHEIRKTMVSVNCQLLSFFTFDSLKFFMFTYYAIFKFCKKSQSVVFELFCEQMWNFNCFRFRFRCGCELNPRESYRHGRDTKRK